MSIWLTRRFRVAGRLAAAPVLVVCVVLCWPRDTDARPNTHAAAISTWDVRASSVVLGLGRAVTGGGDFSALSYNANFSSTSGILSAQFGAHYLTYREADGNRMARGFSAGGVALISVPLADRRDSGLPPSSFAFYLGGIPTALFSGQRNFISVPFVLGVGLPFSPVDAVTFAPWVELSPGLNFDTRIQAVSTTDAIQSAMDGTLTREEVEELVEQGLDINRETTLGKRAGIGVALHLGRDVDLDADLIVGFGQGSAMGLGAALVYRWDQMVPGVRPGGGALEGMDCAALERELRSCPAARGFRPRRSAAPASAPARKAGPAPSPAPQGVSPSPPPRRTMPLRQRRTAPPAAAPRAERKKSEDAKKPAASEPPVVAPPTKAKPAATELPPLQAAPPRRE